MLTFYEMLQLVENDDWRDTRKDAEAAAARANASAEFAADQMGYDSGDHGEEYVGVTPKRKSKVIRGTAERMERSRRADHLKHSGKRLGVKRGDIQDIGTHLDPKIGKGHWVGKPQSAEDGNLGDEDYDVTRQQGVEDVYDVDDLNSKGQVISRMDKTKAAPDIQTAEPSEAKSKEISQQAAKAIIAKRKYVDVAPQHSEKATLELIGELEKLAQVPTLTDKVRGQLKAHIRNEKNSLKTKGVPSQDAPHRSPMAKYMLRKNSKTF